MKEKSKNEEYTKKEPIDFVTERLAETFYALIADFYIQIIKWNNILTRDVFKKTILSYFVIE